MELAARVDQFLYRRAIAPRLRLWRKLVTLLGNGVPIVRALTELRDRRTQASGPKHSEALALNAWIVQVNNGAPFATAIEGWVTIDEQMLISAGEQQGDMSDAFRRLDLILTSRSKILKAVIAGVTYPAVLSVLVFGLLIFYSWRIIPVYAEVASSKGGQFTGLAGSLIWLADTVRSWVWLWILSFVLAIVVFIWSLPRWDGRIRVLVDRHAPYAIYRIMRGTAWMLGMAALVSVGRRVEDALLLLQQHSSGRWDKNRSALILHGIRHGLSLGDALKAAKTEFPDREIIADLLIYSALSGVDAAINLMAEQMLDDSLERINKQSAVMRNVGFIAVAIVIGWTASGLVNMNLQMGTFLSGGNKLVPQL